MGQPHINAGPEAPQKIKKRKNDLRKPLILFISPHKKG